MLYLHECKLEPEAIADYIIDPEKNSFLLEEALYRSNLNKNNRDQDRPKITMSESIYFKKDDEIDGNNKVYKKNNLDYLEDNNLDNKKKRFFNSTSSYFDSLRSEYEFDQNLEEDDSDEKKKD